MGDLFTGTKEHRIAYRYERGRFRVRCSCGWAVRAVMIGYAQRLARTHAEDIELEDSER